MLSLIDYGYYNPALPVGHPFINVPSYPGRFWSSTTLASNNAEAFHVPVSNGTVNHFNKKKNIRSIWPVRAGLLSTHNIIGQSESLPPKSAASLKGKPRIQKKDTLKN